MRIVNQDKKIVGKLHHSGFQIYTQFSCGTNQPKASSSYIRACEALTCILLGYLELGIPIVLLKDNFSVLSTFTQDYLAHNRRLAEAATKKLDQIMHVYPYNFCQFLPFQGSFLNVLSFSVLSSYQKLFFCFQKPQKRAEFFFTKVNKMVHNFWHNDGTVKLQTYLES